MTNVLQILRRHLNAVLILIERALRRKYDLFQATALVVVSNVKRLVIFALDRMAIQGLNLHVLAESVQIACSFKLFLFGRELVDDLLRRNALGLIGLQRPFLG